MRYLIIVLVIVFVSSCKPNLEIIKASELENKITYLDSNYVALNTQYFTINQNEFIGDGSRVINEIVNSSQFIVLGETHGNTRTSEFVSTLIPYVSKEGFKNFAVEVGPHSARKLEQLSTPYENTNDQLSDFYNKYQFKELDDFPIPFFGSTEDAEFLKMASKNKMDIWGLDQEYWSSIEFLLDELLKLKQGDSDYEVIKSKKQEALNISKEWMIKEDESEEGFPVFSNILKEQAVIDFFNVFNEKDVLAQEIISDIKISWDIYDNYRGGVSHDTRVAYMFDNFKKNYQTKKEKTPKVLMKIGWLHATKVKIYGTMEIGSLTESMAKENGTISTNISLSNRYFEIDGNIEDLLKSNPRRTKMYLPFILQGEKEKWAIIDLRKIKKDIALGKVVLPEDENKKYIQALVYGFDYQIILPTNKYVDYFTD